MTFVVTDNCRKCRFTDCVAVCPVDCFHADDEMLYIDPDECIDCALCIPECPVEAIFADVDVPERWKSYIALNAVEAPRHPPITQKQAPLPTAPPREKS